MRTAAWIVAAAIGAAGCNGAPATSAAVHCELAAPALPTGRLHTDGTKLRDEANREVSLRGVNAGSRSKFAPYAPFEFADGKYEAALADYLDRAAAFGWNVMRVPFNWAAVEPARGMDDEAFLRRYDALLDGAWKRGIRTIVDFHQDVYAESFCGDGFPAWTLPGNPPAPHHDCPRWYENYAQPDVQAAFDRFFDEKSQVQADYVALWRRMAARYAGRPGVIGFEPINEPNPGTQPSAAFERSSLAGFYGRILPILRTAAPDALLFVDPIGMTSATHRSDLPRPDGPNIVYAPHYYQPLTIFGGDGRADLVEGELRTLFAPRDAWGAPVFLGEWGAADAIEGSFDLVGAHLAAFDALGAGGAQWQYSVARDRWNLEPLDLVRADGTPNPMAAAWLRPWARAVDGSIVEASWDPAARTFVLRYAPSGGITEVALPSGAAPSGYELVAEHGCVDDRAPGRVLVRADGMAEVRVEIRVK